MTEDQTTTVDKLMEAGEQYLLTFLAVALGKNTVEQLAIKRAVLLDEINALQDELEKTDAGK